MSAFDDLVFEPVNVMHVDGLQEGLFRAHKGKRLITAHRKPGETPFVGGSRFNNSIVDYANLQPSFPGGWITLIYNGDGGTGHAKYQPAPFSASDDVTVLEPVSPHATEPALLLIASMLTQQCVPKFSFGYKLTLHRLGRQKIMIPVITDGNGTSAIDWRGMTGLGEELLACATARAGLVRRTLSSDDDTLPDLTFMPILITDVFDSMQASAAWYDKSRLSLTGEPRYPFVSRTRSSNGVDEFCGRQAKDSEPGNAVTIALDTQVVAYQPVAFYTSQNIQVLRHERLDENTGMVLVSLIIEQMAKFGWGGNGATLGRLRKTRIMAPHTTDAHGNPIVDWDGMGRYGRALRVRAERSLNSALPTFAEPSAP